MRLTLSALSVAVLAVGCASTPPEADPVQLKLNDLDARITRVERIVANQVEVAQRLDEVQGAVRQLRGRLESSSTAMRRWPSSSAICTPIWTSAWRQRAERRALGWRRAGPRAAAPSGRLPRRAGHEPGRGARGRCGQRTLLGRAGGVYPGV